MEGLLVLDRFRLLDELGRGGFAVVYRAWDERLQREVAVKVLERRPASRRVLREAQAAARLNHPSIATLYELGEDAEHVYLVSEFAEGATMRELAAAGELSDREVGELGEALCDALCHAHERGVIHRDVKPENIAVVRRDDGGADHGAGPESRAMLLDFGIAALVGEPGLTRTGEVVGTLAYMAPEQAEGAEASSPTDLYALALVLYEAWSGSNPVARATPAATARAIGEPVPELAALRPDLPVQLCATLDACLDRDPHRRPSASELADQLDFALDELDATSPVPVPGSTSARERFGSAGIGRVLALAALGLTLAGLSWGLGRPGLALVLACLTLPAALLVDRPRSWLLPAGAPLLGWAGLGALFPALAGIVESPRRAWLLGALGWGWVAVAERVLVVPLLFSAAAPAPAGWQRSAGVAGELLASSLLEPAALVAAIWAAGAYTLAALLRARGIVLRTVGTLCWGAAVVAAHRLLAAGGPDPAGAGAIAALACVLAAALWFGPARTPSAGPRRSREGPAAVLEGGTA